MPKNYNDINPYFLLAKMTACPVNRKMSLCLNSGYVKPMKKCVVKNVTTDTQNA